MTLVGQASSSSKRLLSPAAFRSFQMLSSSAPSSFGLLAVLFTQVSAAAISGYLAQRWFGGLATTAAAVVITLALFVYSEAIPKTLAVRAPLRFGLVLARPIAGIVPCRTCISGDKDFALDRLSAGTMRPRDK